MVHSQLILALIIPDKIFRQFFLGTCVQGITLRSPQYCAWLYLHNHDKTMNCCLQKKLRNASAVASQLGIVNTKACAQE